MLTKQLLEMKILKKKGKLYESKIDNSENQNIMVTSGPFRTPAPKNWIWFVDDRY